MKLSEIIITPSRSENIDEKLYYFTNTKEISKINEMTLKKTVDEYGDVHYGLFHDKILISYLHLNKEKNWYSVGMPITRHEYQGRGWATALYDYAITKDNLKVASDDRQTPEAKALWKRLYKNHRFHIFLFNPITGDRIPYEGDDAPWDRQHQKWVLVTEDFSDQEKEEWDSLCCKRGTRAFSWRNPHVLYGTNPTKPTDEVWNP